MKHKRLGTILSIAFTLMASISLFACTFPFEPEGEIATIKDVTVTPSSGTGTFSLSLSYHRNFPQQVTVSCYYTSPDGNTMGIQSYTDDGKSAPDQVRTATFTVTPPDVGLYTATCEDESGASSKSTTFFIDTDPTADVTILEVRVQSLNSRDMYGLEMAYLIRTFQDVSFTCSFDSPDDVITRVITKFTEPGRVEGPPTVLTKAATFSIAAPDGSIKGGVYTATCSDDEVISTKSISFTVAGDLASNKTPTPTPTPSPASASSQVVGRITFSIGTYQSDRPSGGGELDDVTRWCIPEVKIGTNGTLTGSCEYTGTSTHLTQDSIIVTVTGNAVPGGSFNFTYNVSESGPNGWKNGDNPSDVIITSTAAQWYVFYTGSGNFTSPTQASGVANFDYTCDSGASNLFWCSGQQFETFKGTINWSFEP